MGSERRIPAAECTEYPWWVIIDPDAIHGLFSKQQRVGRVAAAVTGPFLSRAEAQAQLGRRRYAYGPNAVVYSLSGHDSSDWRALCHEGPVETMESLRTRAEAAEQRAEAAERELAQARADRALLAGLWLGTVTPRVLPAILPADPGDRERLVAALDAVDLQPSAEACIAAGRAVIARIVAETGGGAA